MPTKKTVRPMSPRAFALLSALAKQSDLDYDKRSRENKIIKIAELASEVTDPSNLKWFTDDLGEIEGIDFEAIAPLVPKGQSLFDFYILNNMRERICKLTGSLCIPAPERMPWKAVEFGTLELGTPAAEVMPIEGSDECLVILSRGLWVAASLASGIIADRLELDPCLLLPLGWKEKPALVQGLLPDVEPRMEMIDQVLTGQPAEYFFPRMDNHHKVCWELLDSAMKTFMFAHEYAHVHLGHVGGNASDTYPARSWNQEFAADLVAIQLAMRDKHVIEGILAATTKYEDPKEMVEQVTKMLEKMHYFYSATGAILVLHLFWRMEVLKRVQASYTDSHPPIQMRMNNIWTFMRMECEADDFDQIFRNSNLTIDHFLRLLPPLEGSWCDRFLEMAFKPLLFGDVDAVMEAIDTVTDTNIPLPYPSLNEFRSRLAELFRDPSAADNEEKYCVLERCLEMIRVGREADPFRSIKRG